VSSLGHPNVNTPARAIGYVSFRAFPNPSASGHRKARSPGSKENILFRPGPKAANFTHKR
jgi:hypothetical protein